MKINKGSEHVKNKNTSHKHNCPPPVTINETQTITGTKTFNHIETTTNIHTYADGRLIERRDENDKAVSTLESFVKEDGQRITSLFIFKDDGITNGNLAVLFDSNDKFVIRPSSSYEIYDNSNSLATTKWCRNNLLSLKESYHNGTEWYRVWSDGWIEQGGKFELNTTLKTLTFLKPYTTTNYSVFWGDLSATQSGINVAGILKSSITPTGFGAFCTSGLSHFYWYACGF